MDEQHRSVPLGRRSSDRQCGPGDMRQMSGITPWYLSEERTKSHLAPFEVGARPSITLGHWKETVVNAAPNSGANRVLTVPNIISLARLAAVPLFAVLLSRGEDSWALVVLALSGISDWLDGLLARALHQESRLGKLLDPAADRLFILVTVIALAVRDLVPWWLVIALFLRDLLLAVLQLFLLHAGWAPLQVHLAGKAGTLMLLYAFPMLLWAHLMSGGWAFAFTAVGWAAAIWGVGLYWAAGVLYVGQARHLLQRQAAT